MERIRVMIVDDHPIFLEGFTTLVNRSFPEIEIVGAFGDARHAILKLESLSPDIVVMDVRMPGMDGVQASIRLRAIDPDLKIVVLTTFKDTDLIQSALAAGVKGYVLKEAPMPVVIENIKSVYHGNVLLPAEFAAQVAWEAAGRPVEVGARSGANRSWPAEVSELTAREQETLALMLDNFNNAAIADSLHLSERTVRNYVSKVYDAIGVHDRAGLVLWAIENHLK